MKIHPCYPSALVLLVPLGVSLTVDVTSASSLATPCEQDSDCHSLQAIESTCGSDGFCTNAFGSGCLFSRMPGWEKKRVCNSEDPPDAADKGVCEPPPFEDYMEVRIISGGWESITFNAWLIQILLSELLQVPATLEPATPEARVNFYDPTGAFQYGTTNTVDAFDNAFRYPDCRNANRGVDGYEPCATLIPEFWLASGSFATESIQKGSMEPPEALGVLARETLFIPKFTSERDPTLLSYIGMQGEKNRQKLADAFLRPTLFKDYCQEVSTNNCSSPDNVAQRPPEDDDEGDRFFLDDVFTGYFRKTDQNNCTLYPTNCTGHVVDYPCEWSSFVEQQFHHLGIALSGDRHEEGSRGHEGWQLTQILKAANATKSNIIIVWALPDPYYQMLIGTDMELHAIVMPPVTQECLAHKRPWSDQCSGDWELRVGDPRGACEDPPTLLHKAISTRLTDELNDPSIPAAEKSPAVTAIQQYTMTAPIYGSWFDLLLERDALKQDRLTIMRDATCQWIINNFDMVEKWVPFSYPRVIVDGSVNSALLVASLVLAILAVLLVLVGSAIVHYSQHRRVIRYAQIEFLRLLLAGLLFMSIGALMTAIPPTTGTCVTTVFFVNIGYSLELVPLLVKVAAINRLMSSSGRMEKVTIERKDLFRSVLAVTALVVIFLIVWTSVDTPERQGELSLSTSMTSKNETIVYRTYYCSSESDVWQYVAFCWTCLLLFSSTVLAFQMRFIRQEFNESQTLAMMTYSHFVFVILRIVLFFLNDLGKSDRASYASILLSLDAIATLAIYFLPKFLVLRTPDANRSGSTFGVRSTNSNPLAGNQSKPLEFSEPLASVGMSSDGKSSDRVSAGLEQQAKLKSEEKTSERSFAEEPEHAAVGNNKMEDMSDVDGDVISPDFHDVER